MKLHFCILWNIAQQQHNKKPENIPKENIVKQQYLDTVSEGDTLGANPITLGYQLDDR